MKNLLLLMPFFMDYQIKLNSILLDNYHVTLVNSDLYDKQIVTKYCSCTKLRWAMRNAFKSIKHNDLETIQYSFIDKISKQIDFNKNVYDVVLCINGAYLPNKLYEILRINNPRASFVYYAWDDLANLIKTSHIKYFDKRFSFNILDCNKKGMTYIPMFVQEEEEGHADLDIYDIAFIASAHSGRAEIAEKLYSKYSGKYRIYIYLYDPDLLTGSLFAHDVPLKNEEYMRIMRCSKAVIDIPHEKQSGPTTRAFDALLTKTKVITTNKLLANYPVWSNNIQCVDKNDIVIDSCFLEKPYENNNYKPLAIKDWIIMMGL